MITASMAWTPARLAWEACGRPDAPGLEFADEAGPCYLCGLPCDGIRSVRRADAILETWNDGTSCRSGLAELVCGPCAWSIKAVVSEKAKPGKRAPWLRCYSVVAWLEGETPRMEILEGPGQRLRILEHLIGHAQEPFGIALADSGQKQLLWRTPLNVGGGQRKTRIDEDLIVYEPRDLHPLVADLNRLLGLGFTKTETAGGDYSIGRITACGIGAWRPLEERIRRYRGGGLFRLAHWISWKDGADEQNDEGRGDDAESGGVAGEHPREPRRPRRRTPRSAARDSGSAHDVGSDRKRPEGLGLERGELGPLPRSDEPAPPARPRPLPCAAGGGQGDFGWEHLD